MTCVRYSNYYQRSKPANWILHKPPLPISFGTHHSKAMLLVYPHGVRVIVHTANLIYVDWNNKSQGLWMQDFPWKDQTNPIKGSGFENDLIEYLSMLKVLSGDTHDSFLVEQDRMSQEEIIMQSDRCNQIGTCMFKDPCKAYLIGLKPVVFWNNPSCHVPFSGQSFLSESV